MTINVKQRASEESDELVDRPVEPRWESSGLALHESIGDCENLPLTHVPSGLAILPNVDWAPGLVERCAIAIEAIQDWDWNRSKDELEADPEYPRVKQRTAEIVHAWREVALRAEPDPPANGDRP